MPPNPITVDDLHGVFAVPPLPRRPGPRRAIDFDAAEQLAAHIEAGGISRYLYGGNAFLYHVSLDEFECLLGWLVHFPESRWAIPSIGPSFGRALDQARLLRRYGFRCAMVLPCNDPRDAAGMEAGLREIADVAGMPLILYLKSEDAFGANVPAGLDAVGRLVDAGVATAIKYAIVRDNPVEDDYLEGLLRRVSRDRILSGIGERPAITHLQTFGLRSMTTGSGCIAPHTCAAFFSACRSGDWRLAAALREVFMPLEDLRDAWGPARVLHHAAELCGIAATGPIPPFVSPLGAAQMAQLAPVATALLETRA